MSQRSISLIHHWSSTLTLFASAHTPLFAILGIRFRGTMLMWFCVGLVILGIGGLLWVLLSSSSTSGTPLLVTRVRPAGAETAAYLGTYILPFIAIPKPDGYDILSYGIFFVVAAAIYCRSSVILINPMLFILGYRIIEIDDQGNSAGYLLTREQILPGDHIQAVRYSRDVWKMKGRMSTNSSAT